MQSGITINTIIDRVLNDSHLPDVLSVLSVLYISTINININIERRTDAVAAQINLWIQRGTLTIMPDRNDWQQVRCRPISVVMS